MPQTSTAPNYVQPLAELIRQFRDKLRAGSVHEARVAHDKWCLIFKGGPCNCYPTLELIEIEPGGTI